MSFSSLISVSVSFSPCLAHYIFYCCKFTKKKAPLIYFAFPFFPLFLPSFHSWHILAFLPLLLYCLRNVLFYDICFSTLLFLCDCFPFLSLIRFQALFYVFPLSTFFFLLLSMFFALCQCPLFRHTLHHLVISSGSLSIPFITLLSPDTYCWVTP